MTTGEIIILALFIGPIVLLPLAWLFSRWP